MSAPADAPTGDTPNKPQLDPETRARRRALADAFEACVTRELARFRAEDRIA